MSDDGEKKTATAIGPTIVIRGKLKSDEDLVVKGRIEAEIQSTKALHIENSGIVKANVQVKSVKVSGVLVGNIAADSRVEIASDGRVVGDILAPKIVISDGAAFKGKIDMQSFDAPRADAGGQAAGSTKPAAEPKAAKGAEEPAKPADGASSKAIPPA
jgi:cytoskeletal protein CcmA (bactofilin family)